MYATIGAQTELLAPTQARRRLVRRPLLEPRREGVREREPRLLQVHVVGRVGRVGRVAVRIVVSGVHQKRVVGLVGRVRLLRAELGREVRKVNLRPEALHVGDVRPRAGDIISLEHPRVEVTAVHGRVVAGGVDCHDILLDASEVRHRRAARVIRELDERLCLADLAGYPLGGAAVAASVEFPFGLVADVRQHRRDAREVDLRKSHRVFLSCGVFLANVPSVAWQTVDRFHTELDFQTDRFFAPDHRASTSR